MKGAILLFLVIVLAYICASPSPESDAAKRNRPQGMLSQNKTKSLLDAIIFKCFAKPDIAKPDLAEGRVKKL